MKWFLKIKNIKSILNKKDICKKDKFYYSIFMECLEKSNLWDGKLIDDCLALKLKMTTKWHSKIASQGCLWNSAMYYNYWIAYLK